ncbi:MAG: 3-phosphoglycerate dehydrogenase, partial [Bacteroidales bacterium]|nr:3-phosphoglycerate dehydrogenase [Bacteroidales bacterium]
MKVLVATEKPFAKAAVDGIRNIVEKAGHTLVLLEKYTSVEDLYKAVGEADAMIVRSDKVTKDVIAAAKNLKIVVRAGAGFDNLDLAACTERGIVAMNTPGQNSNAVAELAIGMMVYVSRNCFNPGTGSELKGKTLGIHAFGNVGKLVAKIAKGFDMKILAFDPYIDSSVIRAEGAEPVSSIAELYKRSNFLSLHIPATAETKKSVGRELITTMPKGGCLVNTARKEVIDEEGLLAALEERPDLKYVTDIAADNQQLLNEKF